MGKSITYTRQSSRLDSSLGAYFERAKPQYEDKPVGDFVHLKDFGARGRVSPFKVRRDKRENIC